MVPDFLKQQPHHIPSGYALRQTFEGGIEPGFGFHPNQVIRIYARGWSDRDWICPLLVVLATPDAPDLGATDRAHGSPIDIGLSGVSAIYHDGMWTGTPDAAPKPIWNTTYAHSITVRSSYIAVAARGNKRDGIDMAELIAVIRSLRTSTSAP